MLGKYGPGTTHFKNRPGKGTRNPVPGGRVGVGMRRSIQPLTLALLACSGSPADAGQPNPPSLPAACDVPAELGSHIHFDDVVVLSFDGEPGLSGHSVTVLDGRITAVGSGLQAPDGATVVPGCGRHLVPGLVDMHVHLQRPDLPAYLRSGVTSVRNLWGFPDLRAMQSELDQGTLVAPTIYGMSPGLDGTPEKWPLTQLVMDPAEARAVVRAQAEAGWTRLKLYQDLRSEVFDSVVAAADSEGLPFGGHVPHRVGLHRALAAGYTHIEHLSGYEPPLNGREQRGAFGWKDIDVAGMDALAASTVSAGVWNCPTLAIFTQIASGDAEVVANRQRMVKTLFDAGAPLLIGTDSGIGRTAPGVSVHEEIVEFVEAGLSPLDALRIATLEAARFLDQTGEFGVVAEGYRADLLLVRGNPVENLTLMRSPDLVLARGVRAN